jgi:preprotein translocase subunit SecA
VHVVTVNDYLARRDAEWMSPIYDFLGLTWGVLQNMQPREDKRAAYAADITYGTNSEFGFDYLRDNMATSLDEKVQHGGRYTEDGKVLATHNFAIVDEVDNILIDEARTPLIISGAPEQAGELYAKFAKLAPHMEAGKKPEGMDPRTKKEFVADYDFEFDEKHKTVAVSERGVEKAERFLGIDHLYRAENGHLVNHLIQALKAQSLYKRDVDYAVVDGQVQIIDEFTGRILEGRRWSEGLHQAIEAKEGVRVQEENQTLATITLQNYFRMYDKLAGMTGTALTEATEFMKIYKLGVVQIPTNRPMVRADKNDQVFKTKGGKWSAVVREIVARHQAGQPVLVGTISVEVSEHLGSLLAAQGVPHVVLNAKPEYAEREGEIVAEAGQPGAVTIATNMAGRGVDIKLGGNAEHLTQLELKKLGYAPTTRVRRAVRADPALLRGAGRGRARAGHGRGRPVHRRHGAPRVAADRQPAARPRRPPGRSGRVALLPLRRGRPRAPVRRGPDLQHPRPPRRPRRGGQRAADRGGILSKQIEKAQRKVEEQNFLIRKRVLEYDDVMNEQRRIVYKYRDEVLEGRDMAASARAQISDVIGRMVDEYAAGDYAEEWDLDGLFSALEDIWPVELTAEQVLSQSWSKEEVREALAEDALRLYDRREEELGSELMRIVERYILLQTIDQRWREHLYDMDYLREGIHLRGFAQIDPLVAYKNEAFTLFTDLMNTIWSDFARMIFHVEVEVQAAEPPPAPAPVAVLRDGRRPRLLLGWGGKPAAERAGLRRGRGGPRPRAAR